MFLWTSFVLGYNKVIIDMVLINTFNQQVMDKMLTPYNSTS